MQIKIAFLIVGVYFITLTSQAKTYTQRYLHDKKCDDKFAHIRIKVLEFFINFRRFIGFRKPIKLNICDTYTSTPSTTEATTPTTVTTTITTTTTATTITTITTTTQCSSKPSLVTLYRLYNPKIDDHFYTASLPEAENTVITYGYMQQTSPGSVATSASDCLCGASLKPVYRLYKPGDHFYTLDETEAVNAVNMYGYVQEGIAFYCADQLNYCGATLPLYRYQRNAEHFYTTDPTADMALLGTYEGITCYIWP